MSYRRFNLKLRVFSAGHVVAMVTCYTKRMTATFFPTDWVFVLYYYVVVVVFILYSIAFIVSLLEKC